MTSISTFEKTGEASRALSMLSEEKITRSLDDLATATIANTSTILEENQKDLDRMDPQDPKYDRLKLSPERIEAIAADIHKVAQLPSPTGRILEERKLDNGL